MEVVGPSAGPAKRQYLFDLHWANQFAPKEGLRLTLTATFSFTCAPASSRAIAATTTAELILCRSSAGGLAWTPVGGPCDCGAGADRSRECTRCHGQNGDPTPPPAVDGTTSTESIGVGAHLVHARGTGLARPVACKECHVVPTVADGIEHPDPNGLPAPVVFGLLGRHDSAAPAWDRTTGTCTDVFCHGSTLRAAETRPSRIWTRIDESERRCDSCHGYPPRPSHPQRADCEACHYMVVATNGVIMNPRLHVDGVLQADTTVSP
jgi:predicted CxxxxCH...CXXCH cytochrome family protein